MRKKMTLSRFSKNALHHFANVLLIISTIFVTIPIIWMVSTSLKNQSEVFSFPPTIIPKEIYLGEFKDLLFNPDNNFLIYLRNSSIVTVSATIICLFLAVLAAYGLSRFNFRAKPMILVYFLFTQMFPFSIILITLYKFFSKLDLLNTHMGLVIAYTSMSLAFSIWMLKNYFDTIPKELEEASYIDGSSKIGTLIRIILPLVGPGIIATGIFIFITSWNEYLIAYVLSTSENVRTLPPGIALTYLSFVKISWNGLMAVSVASALPSIIIFIFLQKWFVKGLTVGAVKG